MTEYPQGRLALVQAFIYRLASNNPKCDHRTFVVEVHGVPRTLSTDHHLSRHNHCLLFVTFGSTADSIGPWATPSQHRGPQEESHILHVVHPTLPLPAQRLKASVDPQRNLRLKIGSILAVFRDSRAFLLFASDVFNIDFRDHSFLQFNFLIITK